MTTKLSQLEIDALTAALGLPPESDADRELEAQIRVAVELIEAAGSNVERNSGVDALAKLVRMRSEGQVLRSEIAWQELKQRSPEVDNDELDDAIEKRARLRDINTRFEAADNPRDYWQAVRDAWAEEWDWIAGGGRTDPYFLSWKFTPIEEQAWHCIRRIGLRVFPQVPVGGVFIDFGDPHLKIGIELDGKAFHNKERDQARDARLWELGWRIFRITGSESVKWMHPPTEPDFADQAEHNSPEWNRALEQWALHTGDGVLWAIQTAYYRRAKATGNELAIALGSLEDHRGIEFPLGITDEDREEM